MLLVLSMTDEELKRIFEEDDSYVLETHQRLSEIQNELCEALRRSKKEVWFIKSLREQITIWKRKWGKSQTEIRMLKLEVEKWKALYKDKVRPKSSIMESQNAISEGQESQDKEGN